MTFRPGDIGFVMHPKSLISRTIAKVMGSKWSHSFMVYDTGRKHYTVETTSYRVIIGNVEEYTKDKNCSMEIWRYMGLIEPFQYMVAEGSYEQYGKLYGYLQLISLGIRRLLMKFGITIRNFIRTGVVCDQVVLYGLTKLIDFKDLDPESIDTEELYQLITNLPQFKLIYEKKLGEIGA